MFYSECCVCISKIESEYENEYECNVKPKHHKTALQTRFRCVLCFFGKTNMEFCLLPIFLCGDIYAMHMENGGSKH